MSKSVLHFAFKQQIQHSNTNIKSITNTTNHVETHHVPQQCVDDVVARRSRAAQRATCVECAHGVSGAHDIVLSRQAVSSHRVDLCF